MAFERASVSAAPLNSESPVAIQLPAVKNDPLN